MRKWWYPYVPTWKPKGANRWRASIFLCPSNRIYLAIEYDMNLFVVLSELFMKRSGVKVHTLLLSIIFGKENWRLNNVLMFNRRFLPQNNDNLLWRNSFLRNPCTKRSKQGLFWASRPCGYPYQCRLARVGLSSTPTTTKINQAISASLPSSTEILIEVKTLISFLFNHCH